MQLLPRNIAAAAGAATLVLLMGLTRFHPLGSSLSLPDASLAVFFLAGLYLRSAWLFVAFLAEAALIDYVAITHGGVSAWCVSPAYGFLVPTYGVLWYTGRRLQAPAGLSWRNWALCLGGALGATVIAFGISNGSFYLLSGRFAGTPLMSYLDSVMGYFRSYTGSTLAYVAVGLAMVSLVRMGGKHAPTAPTATSGALR